jgi:flagellar basal-body rod modification protein FlgD
MTTSIAGTTGTSTTTPPKADAAKESGLAAGMLGKDDFLALLVSQLKNQDPMNPTDSQDFMGQMAQFTSVEQLSNMAAAVERMSTASQTAQSVSLLGKHVSWKKADGTAGEGVAESVAFTDGLIRIKVGETQVAPNEIEGVR